MTRARRGGDVDDKLHVLRDNLARADAMVCATEHQIERYTWRAEGEDDKDGDGDGDDDRRLDHLSQLLAAAKEAVRAALHAGGQLADDLAKNRRGP